ncbi:MAG: transporter substrate-binding domain-containing protein, partial [Treponema sp.]|nr:transporter substrate-binding domain-containing protein [Treponema sp.]
MKKILACSLMALMLFGFTSCSKKKEKRSAPADSDFQQGTNVSSDGEEIVNWTNEQGCICVLFGEGFNSGEVYEEMLNRLSSVYGLDSNGGLLYPILFPDDLKGKTIGVQIGTTGDIYAEDIENASIERYSKYFEAINALIQGKIDA